MLKRPFAADSASFRTIIDRYEATTGRHTSAAVDAAGQYVRASVLPEFDHDDKHAGISEAQTRNTLRIPDSSITTVRREKQRFLIHLEFTSAVETAQLEKMRSMRINLVEATICNVFATSYCVATIGIMEHSFSFVSVNVKMIYRRARNETQNPLINDWSLYNTFMQELAENIVIDPVCKTHAAAFITQLII